VPVVEGQRSGLDRPSWIMVDKIVTVPRAALKLPAVGKLDARELSELEDALRNWLDL
jgi:mRNA-degrading endonuclease toxin of MazEF toxin-antitoxin module